MSTSGNYPPQHSWDQAPESVQSEPRWDAGRLMDDLGIDPTPSGPSGRHEYPPHSYPPAAPTGPGQAGTGRSRKKFAVIVGLVTVLVVGLLAGGYFAFVRSDSPAFTFDGEKIDKPNTVLTAAESSLAAIVETRHGASGSDTRCYFAVPKTRAAGAKNSDVDHALRCGPVLFVDGDVSRQYLSFALTSAAARGGAVALTAAATPTSTVPEAIAGSLSLGRPDKATPPAGPGGLAVPSPPPADADVLARVSLGNVTVPVAPATAVIGSRNGGVRLRTLGEITRYGAGDEARSAPAGHKLIAFTLLDAPTSAGANSGSSALALRVLVGSTARAVPAGRDTIVVAVPTGSDALLQTTDSGITQTLSLLTGAPGSGNILVGQRKYHSQTINRTLAVNDHWTYPGVAAIDRGARLSIDSAALSYWGSSPSSRNSHPVSRSTAYLIVDLTYTYVGPPTGSFTTTGGLGPFGISPGKLNLRLPDGRTIPAKDIDTRPDYLLDVFEVPASFTTGIVIISGSSTNANKVTATFTPAVSFRVTIPAG